MLVFVHKYETTQLSHWRWTFLVGLVLSFVNNNEIFFYYCYYYNIFLNVWIFCYIIGCLSLNISGCVDVDITSRLYSDLCEAQLALSVQNYLHLIYLITPYDLVAHITPDWSVMFNLVSVTYSCPGTQSTKYCKISNNQFFLSWSILQGVVFPVMEWGSVLVCVMLMEIHN